MNSLRIKTELLAGALVVCLVVASSVLSQTPEPRGGGGASQGSEFTSLTMLRVIVADSANRFVDGLRREDFGVLEDGERQHIALFSVAEGPVSYGLVVDNSGSLRTQLSAVVAASRSIVEAHRTGDEAFVLRFVSRDNVQLLQDFTSDTAQLMRALDRFRIEQGQTALVDALYAAVEHLNKTASKADEGERLRALVVVTDGEDRASTHTRDELFKLLDRSNVQIFVVGLVRELDRESGLLHGSAYDKSKGFLRRLAADTGGRAFFPKKTEELPAIAQQIAHDLHRQYLVGYAPSGKDRNTRRRKIEVRALAPSRGDKYNAIARPYSQAR